LHADGLSNAVAQTVRGNSQHLPWDNNSNNNDNNNTGWQSTVVNTKAAYVSLGSY